MFSIRFVVIEPLVRDIDDYFESIMEKFWFDNPLVNEILKDIDRTEVRNRTDLESEVLGPISPKEISSGVKLIILLIY